MLRRLKIRLLEWWISDIDEEIESIYTREGELYISRARAEKRLAALRNEGRAA